MKKIDLGQSIQIIANIGVIAGIVFLGLEIRQMNQKIRDNTEDRTDRQSYSQLRLRREVLLP